MAVSTFHTPAVEAPGAAMFERLAASLPRAVRIFSDQFEVIYDNAPDRDSLYPIYRDAAGQVVSIPPPGETRHAWPVVRALASGKPVTRNYWIPFAPPELDHCFRVRAWVLPAVGAEGPLLVVEETERIDQAQCHDERLKRLDVQLTALIRRIADFLATESDPDTLRIRIENPNLQPCFEIKQCESRDCPGYGKTENPRCWELDSEFCPEGDAPSGSLARFRHCEECSVLRLSCPDPLTRVGENFNRMLSLLQLKYEEAIRAHEQVQQAERLAMVGELAMGIAHEIKNPLSVIIGRLDCLGLELESLTPGEVGEDLAVMRMHAARMRHVLDNLMNLARPEQPDPRPLSLLGVIHETLAITRKTLESSRVFIETTLPAHLPDVLADPVQVQQVLINLMLNARDAMPGGGRLGIEAQVTGAIRPGVEITVRDSGEGIVAERLPLVFTPFFTTRLGQGGTGLGLPICRRIMTQHGGRIEVRSKPGEGAAFILWFPIEGQE